MEIIGLFFLIPIILIIIILLIVLVIIGKVRNLIGAGGVSMLRYAFANKDKIMAETLNEKKSVSGMTKILAPKIREDFPGFNETVLFQDVEKTILKILNALEQGNKISKDDSLALIKDSLNEKIEDMRNSNTSVVYDNVAFHKSAIKDYRKENGAATITVSTGLEYKDENGELVQTRFICNVIHVFDNSKFKGNNELYIVHCPNCGAPVANLRNNNCEYCNADMGKILLKTWRVISYEDEFKRR